MALIGLFTADRGVARSVRDALPGHDLARSVSWERFGRLVRERPIQASVVDLDACPRGRWEPRLVGFRRSYPRHGVVALAGQLEDPRELFRLGRAAIPELIVLRTDRLRSELPRAVARSLVGGTSATVVRRVSPHVPRSASEVLTLALDGVHRSWSADVFAHEVGYSRPFLSERLKEAGLPSTGHLLTWTRLLHAGHWLTEPGRSGESVSRQLEYANGSTFRRALRNYVGATPTEIAREGGLAVVLAAFVETCTFDARPFRHFSVA